MKTLINILNPKALGVEEQFQPTVILLSSAVLLTVHRYFGSMEFAAELFTGSGYSVVYMFFMAFILMGLIPLGIITMVFHESPKNYGLQLGDWKKGLPASILLFLFIAAILLIPSSGMEEMKSFYPLDREATRSATAFIRLELLRGLFFYTAWEFFFRGFMLFGLRKYLGDWVAICIQTVPSCLWHIGMPAGEIFASIIGGILFGVLALRTRSIWWAFLLHFLIGTGLDFFISIQI